MFGGVPAKKKQLWRSPGFEPAALRFETYDLNHWDVHPSGNNHTTTLGYLSNNDLLKCQSKYSVFCSEKCQSNWLGFSDKFVI